MSGEGAAPRFRGGLVALRAVVSNRELRWLEASWLASIAASWIFVVAALVVAYRLAGPTGVALVGLARMLPAALAAPLIVVLERHVAGRRLLVVVQSARLAAVGLALLGLLAGIPPVALLPLVAVKAAAGALVRPTSASLVPALAASPEELVAANVASSTGEGVGTLVGPVIGGFATAVWGPAAACALAGLALLAAVAAAAAVRPSDERLVRPLVGAAPPEPLRSGLDALRERPGARLIVGSFAVQVVVRGILNVLVVVAAIDLLGLGDPGVGLLNAAIGLGGLTGAAIALGIAGNQRIAPAFALALVGWGLPIVAVGAVPVPLVAIGLLVVLGTSNAVLDISGFTLLQRLVPNRQRQAVFGLLEGIAGAGVAVGSVLAPVLLSLLGSRVTMLVVGGVLPLLAVLAWRRLAALDDEAVVPARQLALLRSMPMFRPLPLTVVERLAGGLVRVEFAPGELLTRQGDEADCFFAIETGEVAVVRDGVFLRSCGPRTAVGEIGLLRRMPRTATVRATLPTVAYAVRGDEFVAAVTGSAASATAAETIIDDRLAFRAEEAAADT